jgi:hypothetical protein
MKAGTIERKKRVVDKQTAGSQLGERPSSHAELTVYCGPAGAQSSTASLFVPSAGLSYSSSLPL